MKIMNMDFVLHDVETKIVSFTESNSRFETATCHPHCKRLRMMIAAKFAPSVGITLDHRSAAKFATPNDERIIQESTLLQVFDESRAALIGFSSLLCHAFVNFAVVVPAFVE